MVKRIFNIAVYAGLCVVFINGMKKPDFLEACHRNDPNINECGLKNAKKALPFIIKGDKSSQIPSMTPLHVMHINVQPSHNLQMNLTDLYLYGLEKGEATSVTINIPSNDLSVGVFIPVLTLISNYTIKGKLQILPIEGDGPSNITFNNVEFLYSLHWSIQPRKNINYAIMTHHELEFKCEKANYHFEHLFNGNKQLGDTVSDFMENNWRAVHKDMSPLIAEAIDAIISSIVGNILSKIPYDDLFLP